MSIFVNCAACGKQYSRSPRALKRTIHHFCSKQCRETPCIPRECTVCHKNFLATGHGWSTIMFCSNECKNARNSRIELHKRYYHAEKNCEHCGQAFRLNKANINVTRFCSYACASASGSHIHKGENHPAWKPKIKYVCAHCGEAFELPPSEMKRKTLVFCSNKCKIDYRVAHKVTKACEQCGKEFTRDAWNADRARFCSVPCKGAWVCAHTQSPTSIEIAISDLLNQMNVEHETQKAIGPYSCDVYISAANLVIEIDGDFWHSLPKAKVKDRIRNTFLLNHDYRILRLPEHKIRKDLPWCKQQILKALKPGAWQSPLW